MDLFDQKNQDESHIPFAEKCRPNNFDQFVGQAHLVGPDGMIRKLLVKDKIPSLILWGPPGSGKTSLAHLIAKQTKKKFYFFSAVLEGVQELRKLIEQAKQDLKYFGKSSIVFIDEIHRFNKSQQDALLPHVEQGNITLIGATTENPSFEIISPLLSRCQVLTLHTLTKSDLKILLEQACAQLVQTGETAPHFAERALENFLEFANGDARKLLGALELIARLHPSEEIITVDILAQLLQSKQLRYDKGGEEHYNTISAFIKSMRGSDANAAMYYLARMLEAGEDPLFIARRMVIFASEDVGLADTQALPLALAAYQTFERIGLPEGWIPLAHAAAYLAKAPKSNASYMAYKQAKIDVKQFGNLPIPLHLRNAPTDLMKSLNYGKDYQYPHDFKDAKVDQQYLPDELKDRNYFLKI